MMSVPVWLAWQGHDMHVSMHQLGCVLAGNLTPSVHPALQVDQTLPQDGRLNFVQTAVHSQHRMMIARSLSIVPERACVPTKLGRRGRNCPPVSTGPRFFVG